MKKLMYFIAATMLVTACGEKETGDKQAQLDALIKEQTALNEKIKALKAELEAGDSAALTRHLVSIQQIRPAAFRHFVEVQARVDGDESVTVSARTQGIVSSIIVKEGDRVVKGQVLATLDDQIIRQTQAEVQTQFDFANNIYEKQKNLWDQKIGSEVQFLTAKNNKESLEKRLAAVNEQLDLTRIKSPVNGTVDQVSVKIGQAVMPGMQAFGVVNLSGLKVKGEVGESYVGKIKKGDDVVLYFPDLGKEVPSKVGFASRSINTLNRTFGVEVPIPASVDGLSPNMIVVMKIVDYKTDSAIVLPVDLLQRSGDGNYVMIAVNENGKLVSRRKVVTTGRISNGHAEILEGISGSDQVITTGYRDLNEGDEITTQ